MVTVEAPGFWSSLFEAFSANSGDGCGSGGDGGGSSGLLDSNNRLNYRLHANSTAVGAKGQAVMDQIAAPLFRSNFNINIVRQSTSTVAALNHGCPRNACNTTCGPLRNCATTHHRSANRLLNVNRVSGTTTFRFVDFPMCLYMPLMNENHPTHIPGVFTGPRVGEGRDMVIQITATYLNRTVIHEITHLFGAEDNRCTPGQEARCVMNRYTDDNIFNMWCDSCANIIRSRRN